MVVAPPAGTMPLMHYDTSPTLSDWDRSESGRRCGLRHLLEFGLNRATPAYVALIHGDDYLESADRLDALVRELVGTVPDDAVIWNARQGTIAALIRCGEPLVFEDAAGATCPHPKESHAANGHAAAGTQQRLIFGYAPTAVIVALGRAGWDYARIQRLLDALKVKLARNSVLGLRSGGRTGRLTGATLNTKQVRELAALADG
jgi:hypothetical protein